MSCAFERAASVPQRNLRENLLGAVRAIVDATPDNGEGSRFHLRSEWLWEVEDDLRRLDAGEPVWEEWQTPFCGRDECVSAILRDVGRMLGHWAREEEPEAQGAVVA